MNGENVSQSCGGGVRKRTFSITRPATNGGSECRNAHGEEQEEICNSEECRHSDCEGSWSGWSNCAQSCGEGKQTSEFRITKPATGGGIECDYDNGDIQERDCNNGTSCKLSRFMGWMVGM